MIDKKKITAVILAGAITASGAVSAYAADQPAIDLENQRLRKGQRVFVSEFSEKAKSAVDGLVADSTITQEQADAILKACSQAGRRGPMRIGRISIEGLVEEGKITQEQADTISSAIRSGFESGKSIRTTLDELVASGTITEAQKEAVLNYTPDKLVIEKPFILQQNGETADRPIVIQQDKLDGLVSKGTITKEQADAIKDIAQPLQRGAGVRNIVNKVFDPFAHLVASGTITQAQADAVRSAIKSTTMPEDN